MNENENPIYGLGTSRRRVAGRIARVRDKAENSPAQRPKPGMDFCLLLSFPPQPNPTEKRPLAA